MNKDDELMMMGSQMSALRLQLKDAEYRASELAKANANALAEIERLRKPPEAAPRDIAQELIAGLEEVRDMRKCKKCEYPNCFCVQPQPQETRS